ncbi:MAG: type II toxin-antitoxin system VapC family toxin [Rhodanobacter sp.]|jgi:predicted nucleic acid-binding protein|nr:type II toxin-antitoxin system VapC family toxin [Rhodanobacter sp.]
MSRLVYLLDTNIVSYYLRRVSPALEKTMDQALRDQSSAISVLTRAELRYGQALMETVDRRRELIDAFLRQIPALPWTVAAADHFGALKSHHHRHGTRRGDMDTQIAAHALAEDLTLVTHNTRDFTATPGLRLLDWMA